MGMREKMSIALLAACQLSAKFGLHLQVLPRNVIAYNQQFFIKSKQSNYFLKYEWNTEIQQRVTMSHFQVRTVWSVRSKALDWEKYCLLQ